MTPHQETYSFAQSIPFNLVISVVTIIMLISKKELRKIPKNTVSYCMMFLLVWTSITTMNAYDVDWSYKIWDMTTKSFVFMFLIMASAYNKVRIHSLVWIMVASLGFFGVKGGLFTIITAGTFKVVGSANTMLFDNNSCALALVLTLPLVNYLRIQSKLRLIRIAMAGVMVLQIVSVIGSYSRGGMVSLAFMVGLLWWSSKNKVTMAVLGVAILGVGLSMMPDSFWERMNSVHDAAAGKDESFQGRVNAWYVAVYYAIDHFPIGAGFYGPQLPGIFNYYLPGQEPHAAHSIYFQVLGEHGFPALFVYLVMLAAAIFNFQYVMREAKGWVGWEWIVNLANMCRVSLLSFYLGASALSMAYYDVMMTLLTLSVILRKMTETHKKEPGRDALDGEVGFRRGYSEGM
ncbi:putative O-glycosylation ligase, exosortase A system-associated [Azospirillaceae bacterium]